MNEDSLGVEKHHFSFENGMWRCFGLTPICPYNGYGKTIDQAFAAWKRGVIQMVEREARQDVLKRLIAGKPSLV